MVLLLVATMPAILRKQLGEQTQQEDSYQDGHVGNQHGRVRHFEASSWPLAPGFQLEAG